MRKNVALLSVLVLSTFAFLHAQGDLEKSKATCEKSIEQAKEAVYESQPKYFCKNLDGFTDDYEVYLEEGSETKGKLVPVVSKEVTTDVVDRGTEYEFVFLDSVKIETREVGKTPVTVIKMLCDMNTEDLGVGFSIYNAINEMTVGKEEYGTLGRIKCQPTISSKVD